MIQDHIIEKILEATNIEDVVSEYIPALKKEGNRYKCCCPMHSERTPSFVVTPSRNMYYCFGCHKGGNAITFLTDTQGMSFPEAVKHLANKHGITIEEDKSPRSAEEISQEKRRLAMLSINKEVNEFFKEQLLADNEHARFALDYAIKRWGKKYVEQEEIGYAPGNRAILNWAKDKGISTDLLLELGLIVRGKKGNALYDFYFDRLIIPIKSQTNQVLGFTARNFSGEKPKYLNSKDSEIFHKDEIIFGINQAFRAAAKDELFYLVEGAPDVMRLQSIGIYNAIAPLGSAWSVKQFEKLRRFNPTLCFIPDIDKPKAGDLFGAGINAVIKAGIIAHNAGFRVIVKEIDSEEEVDPDSYIHSPSILEEIPKEDFIFWYAEKLLIGKQTASERAEVMRTIAKHLAVVQDKELLKILIRRLAKLFGTSPSMLENATNEAVKGNVEKKSSSGGRMLDQELYQKFGFYERNHCYFALGKENNEQQWSNFTLEPLFHIKDQLNPKRLFRMVNVYGQEEIIEIKQPELGSLQAFRNKVEGIGNFIWMGKEEQLTKLKFFLYEKTETALEITQLGWQENQFFAFGNGVLYNNQWLPVDEFGIVRLGDIGNFYLPAASKIYCKERRLFQFERRFVHLGLSEISFRKYSDKLIEVFGDNAIVGICFMMATLFKDVVTSVTKNFPILNMFGPKGSGKSELGHSLMAFFIINNEPPNISSATDAALADTVAQCANALVHIDEYKNTIELNRREFIKGLYDGVGRTRMNMDRDKKRETTAVDCGVMLSGQEMPTIDIAIFSRLLYLAFSTSEFSVDAKRKFDELKSMRDLGLSHITLDLLKHRKRVESDFRANYKSALADILASIDTNGVEDRIFRNWVIPLAIYRTLSGVIDVSFTYKTLLQICLDGIHRQNRECKSTNELAGFWTTVDFLHQNGEIFIDADYRIKYENSFRGKGMKDKMIFQRARPILYLCTKRVMTLYKKNGKAVGDNTLSLESLRYYLEHSKEYIGTKNAVRFKNISNTIEATHSVTNENGIPTIRQTSRTDWALCFDYAMLAENYNINLEIDTEADDEIDPIDIDVNDRSKPY